MTHELKLENQICHRFYVASNAITRAYRPHLNKLDLSYPQYLIMMVLWERNDIEIGEIKSQTKIDGGALSLIIKKMEAKDLIGLSSSNLDKRVKKVTLTQKGAALQKQARKIPNKLRCLAEGISHEDLTVLTGLIDKLIVELDHDK